MPADKLPRHVGIIMDGNGRWASERGKSREAGHRRGVEVLEEIVEYAFRRGIEAVSLYAFSTENWARPKKEVDALFSLIRKYFASSVKKLAREGARVVVLGDLSAFPPPLRRTLEKSADETKGNRGHILAIGVNYGGRQEIARAARRAAEAGEEITPEVISAHLDAPELPDLDLVIRTSGEMRLSNFMLWQAAYAELYFTPVYWPDFTASDFELALDSYAARDRRFGGVSARETGGNDKC